MIFIGLIFIFCGIAIAINKKNKFYADKAAIVFAGFLLFAVVFAFAVAYFSPSIKTSTVHTIYKNKQNANATITLDDNTITLDTQKTNQTKKNVDRIIANRLRDHQKGQLTLSKNKVNSTRDFDVLILKGDPNGTKISRIDYGNVTDTVTAFGYIPDPLFKTNNNVVIVTLVNDKHHANDTKTKKALEAILDNPQKGLSCRQPLTKKQNKN